MKYDQKLTLFSDFHRNAMERVTLMRQVLYIFCPGSLGLRDSAVAVMTHVLSWWMTSLAKKF